MPLRQAPDPLQRSIHAQIAGQIGRQIVSGAVLPGGVLPTEHSLSQDLNVSRTVIREAIKLLSAKGLVESRPRTGTRVRARAAWNMLDHDVLAWRLATGPTEQFAHDLFEMREVFEPAAAEIAARRQPEAPLARARAALAVMAEQPGESAESIEADFNFHQAILAATDNEFLISLGALIAMALRVSFHLSKFRQGARRQSVPAHAAVFAAIEAGDGPRARACMNALLVQSKQDMLWVLQNHAKDGALPLL